MQALYAFFQTGEKDLPAAEKQLIRNIDRIEELYIWQLSFLVELFTFFRHRADEAKQKYLPTDEDLHPSTRFIDNRIIALVENNQDFQAQCQRFKINWADEREMFRKLYNDIRAGEPYQKYMHDSKTSFGDDRNILIKLIRNHFFPSEMLQSFFEEKNIHWADDFDVAMLMVMKTFKIINPEQEPSTPLPSFYESEEVELQDKEYARELMRKAIIHSSAYDEIIAEKAKNWELERIAMLDVILLKMAIAELLQFPSIPVKVTINEYIDISKQYSTPKSKMFINGILDKLTIEFKKENKIKKTGRGLIEK